MSVLACSQPSQVAGRNFQVPSQNTTPAEFTASNKVSLTSSGLALACRASSWALVQALDLWHGFIHLLLSMCTHTCGHFVHRASESNHSDIGKRGPRGYFILH